MSEEFVYQWSVKLDNGEIFLVRANEELDLVRRVASLKEHINVPAPRSQAKGAPAVYSPSEPDQELESIEIDSITLASGGEHPRWVVKGGWATQYGITCWPETLQHVGLLATLDPMKENLIDAGYVAYYSKKPKKDDPSKMTADKVVRIEALGATPDDIKEGDLPF